MNKETKIKLIQHYFDFDYPVSQNLNIDQANLIVSKIINDFLKRYGSQFNSKTFIYEYSDDLYSLIGYHILHAISEITNFTFVLYGKPKKTKKYVLKSKRILSKREFNKIKDKSVLLSHNNPIYEVLNLQGMSSDFIYAYSIVSTITPDELFTLQKFYEYDYIPHEYFYKDNKKMQAIQNWINNPFQYYLPIVDKININQSNFHPVCNLIWVETGDSEEILQRNIISLNKVEQSDDINFYFYEGEEIPPILTDLNFQISIKRKSNIPDKKYKNLNEKEIFKDIYNFECGYRIIGRWPDDKYNEILGGIE